MLLQGLMIFALSTGFAADDNAEKIVGTWAGTLEEGGMKIELTFVFTKDGKAKLSATFGKKDLPPIEGTYKVEKDKLTLTRELKGKADVEVNTIKELTKDKLILIDDKTKKEITMMKK